MKKIILSAIVCFAMGAMVSAAEVNYYTNMQERVNRSLAMGEVTFKFDLVNPADVAWVDEQMAASTNIDFTLVWAPLLKSKGFTKIPVKILEQWKVIDEYAYDFLSFMLNEGILWNGNLMGTHPAKYPNSICMGKKFWRGDKSIKTYKKYTLSAAAKCVKRQIRSEGKSFVAKEGSNPVQDRLDAVSAALDAPKMAGLKEALAACGITLEADMEKAMMTDAEISALKEAVMFGDKPFSAYNQNMLLMNLGVEAFNKFVEDYNN